MRALRVLRVLTRPNVGGPMRQAVALWHEHHRLGLRPLLVVGRCGPGEAGVDLASTGIPRLALEDVQRHGPDAQGLLELSALRRRVHPRRDFEAARALAG